METNNTLEEIREKIRTKLPYLLRATGILSLVLSIIAFLFYLSAAIFQLYNPNLLNVNNILGINYQTNLTAYVIISALLNLIIIVSIILTFKVNKHGFWLLVSSSLALLVNEIAYNKLLFVSYVSIYLIYSFLIVLYSRRFFVKKG